MDYQTVIALGIVAATLAVFLVRITRNRKKKEKGGCGHGCGCDVKPR